MPSKLPNLSGIASQNLVESIGGGDNYKASYINWARTFQLLHDSENGWMIEAVPAADGGLVHRAPKGGYLMIRLVHIDGTVTTATPQAVMDNRNKSIPFDLIDSRDITDTHRRGGCMALAMHFGLAYELWAKMPLESGYSDHATDKAPQSAQGIPKPEKFVFDRDAYVRAQEEYGEDLKILSESLDDKDFDGAIDIYLKLPDWVKSAVNVAPTKLPSDLVPVLTTANRAAIKSDEWGAALRRNINSKKQEAA